MNTFYIVQKDVWQKNIHCFHPTLGSAYLSLANGWILVSGHFLDHSGLEHWEAQDVTILPHPTLEGNQQLADDAVAKLASLGVQKGHTVLDVARVAGKLHPAMKLRAF